MILLALAKWHLMHFLQLPADIALILLWIFDLKHYYVCECNYLGYC
jgi:hypothetical protein